jgi:hypothetical protein
MGWYAPVLALLGKVSFFKASRVLSLKSSLLKLDIRSYTAWHARVLTISDMENISYAKQIGSYSFNLIKEVF